MPRADRTEHFARQALNFGQKAEAKGLTVMRVADPDKRTAEE